MKEILSSIEKIARNCGQIMLNADRSKSTIDAKAGHKNFVTTYDKKIQEILKTELTQLIKEAAFIGEEDEIHTFSDKGYAFIVDPIDGTTNFIKDYKVSCVSIGLIKDGNPYLGVIYNPYLDEMYSAIKGHGAYLNGNRIYVSNCELSEGIVLFGTAPYYDDLSKISFDLAAKYLKECIDVRRSGSAALDLCAVAAGRAEIYFEPLICPWDIAAGSIIVTEAGGLVKTMDGKDITLNSKCSIFASNGIAKLS